MSSNRDIASLLDIAKAAKQVLKFKGNLDKTAFLQDDKTQSAILYQLLIIGEAVKRLSQELRQQYPEIPWSLMACLASMYLSGCPSVAIHRKRLRSP